MASAVPWGDDDDDDDDVAVGCLPTLLAVACACACFHACTVAGLALHTSDTMMGGRTQRLPYTLTQPCSVTHTPSRDAAITST